MYYNDNGELIQGRPRVHTTEEEARRQYNQNRKNKPGYQEYNRERSARWNKENPERHRELQRQSRARNLERENATAKLKRKSRRQILWDAKDVPCMDCGIKYNPWQMDFDHRPGTEKVKAVSRMLCVSLDRLELEISKCDVLCSNCHRDRTYNRSQYNGNLSKELSKRCSKQFHI